MKQAIGWLLLLITMAAFFLWASPVSAQTEGLLVKQGDDPVGVITVDDHNSAVFDLNIRGISQKTAVNILIDNCIDSRSTAVQTVGDYTVTYKDKVYTISSGNEGYPMTFTSITDVRKQLKLALKADLGVTD